LAAYFIDQFCRDMGKAPRQLAPTAREFLEQYPWEGNVRELRNVIERAVIFSKGPTIGPDLMPPEVAGTESGPDRPLPLDALWAPGESIETALARVEAHIIQRALKRCGENKTRAAEMMGISRFALNRRLERLEKMKPSG
jgi:two-component system response regulator AtoC